MYGTAGYEVMEYARRCGRDWEQGRRRPSGAARVLLTVIAHEPEAIERALAAHELMPAVAEDIRYATPRLPTG